MNPATSYSTLHILPKSSNKLSSNTHHIRRYIEPQTGILWEMVAPIFIRNGWQLQEQTALFLKAYHEQSEQMIIISKMGRGHVLTNHHGHVFGASNLHEIEDLAENQTPKAPQITKQPWLRSLVANLKQFIS